jgi:transcriptional regulator with XRE-family HTH domain
MLGRTRKILALLAVMAAAAAGGAAYAGAQDDSGNRNGDRAAQQRPDRGPGGCAGRGMHRQSLAALARELGVTRAKLRAALNAVGAGDRPEKGDLAADLAQALGVERSAVEEILEDGPRGPGRDLVEDLASGLGIDESRVEEALEQLHENRHDEFAAALAEELGLDAADVEDALESVRPGPPPRP